MPIKNMATIKHTQLQLSQAGKEADSTLVLPVFDNEKFTAHIFSKILSAPDRKYLVAVQKEAKKDFGAIEKVLFPSGKSKALLMGLGSKEKWNFRAFERAARIVVFAAKKYHQKKITILLDDFMVENVPLERLAENFSSNVELAQYDFSTYKAEPKGGWPAVWQVLYVTKADTNLSKSLAIGSIIGKNTNAARELANTPGGIMTPKRLANAARASGKENGFSVRVLGEDAMRKLGMGGVLGVSSGSPEEAQFVAMEYWGKKSKKAPFVFIGKGITFDSGGLQIKPSQSMEEMHMDMSGGAAVIFALATIARLKLDVNVIGIVPAVENMPSGGSYRPGDLLKTMSGKTIEVGHTDAEGRVILSDALTYAERYKPKLVVDVATLTGACTVALGHYLSAVLSPQEKVAKFMLSCGEASGDYLWQLPLWEEYESHVKGYTGDVLNTGRFREAGTIQGAAFLYQFAKKFNAWAHVDIASTMTGKEDQYLTRGASGVGTRLLVEIARRSKEFI